MPLPVVLVYALRLRFGWLLRLPRRYIPAWITLHTRIYLVPFTPLPPHATLRSFAVPVAVHISLRTAVTRTFTHYTRYARTLRILHVLPHIHTAVILRYGSRTVTLRYTTFAARTPFTGSFCTYLRSHTTLPTRHGSSSYVVFTPHIRLFLRLSRLRTHGYGYTLQVTFSTVYTVLRLPHLLRWFCMTPRFGLPHGSRHAVYVLTFTRILPAAHRTRFYLPVCTRTFTTVLDCRCLLPFAFGLPGSHTVTGLRYPVYAFYAFVTLRTHGHTPAAVYLYATTTDAGCVPHRVVIHTFTGLPTVLPALVTCGYRLPPLLVTAAPTVYAGCSYITDTFLRSHRSTGLRLRCGLRFCTLPRFTPFPHIPTRLRVALLPPRRFALPATPAVAVLPRAACSSTFTVPRYRFAARYTRLHILPVWMLRCYWLRGLPLTFTVTVWLRYIQRSYSYARYGYLRTHDLHTAYTATGLVPAPHYALPHGLLLRLLPTRIHTAHAAVYTAYRSRLPGSRWFAVLPRVGSHGSHTPLYGSLIHTRSTHGFAVLPVTRYLRGWFPRLRVATAGWFAFKFVLRSCQFVTFSSGSAVSYVLDYRLLPLRFTLLPAVGYIRSCRLPRVTRCVGLRPHTVLVAVVAGLRLRCTFTHAHVCRTFGCWLRCGLRFYAFTFTRLPHVTHYALTRLRRVCRVLHGYLFTYLHRTRGYGYVYHWLVAVLRCWLLCWFTRLPACHTHYLRLRTPFYAYAVGLRSTWTRFAHLVHPRSRYHLPSSTVHTHARLLFCLVTTCRLPLVTGFCCVAIRAGCTRRVTVLIPLRSPLLHRFAVAGLLHTVTVDSHCRLPGLPVAFCGLRLHGWFSSGLPLPALVTAPLPRGCRHRGAVLRLRCGWLHLTRIYLHTFVHYRLTVSLRYTPRSTVTFTTVILDYYAALYAFYRLRLVTTRTIYTYGFTTRCWLYVRVLIYLYTCVYTLRGRLPLLTYGCYGLVRCYTLVYAVAHFVVFAHCGCMVWLFWLRFTVAVRVYVWLFFSCGCGLRRSRYRFITRTLPQPRSSPRSALPVCYSLRFFAVTFVVPWVTLPTRCPFCHGSVLIPIYLLHPFSSYTVYLRFVIYSFTTCRIYSAVLFVHHYGCHTLCICRLLRLRLHVATPTRLHLPLGFALRLPHYTTFTFAFLPGSAVLVTHLVYLLPGSHLHYTHTFTPVTVPACGWFPLAGCTFCRYAVTVIPYLRDLTFGSHVLAV